MWKCRYCGKSEYINGMRYLLDCYLFPSKKKETKAIVENTKKSNTIKELWVCHNCYASEGSLEDLAIWEDDD